VFLHPSGVYGTGPTDSPGTNQFIIDLAKGKIPLLLPGGFPVVFAPDVAQGHILAEEKAKTMDRFILSDRYFTLSDLAALIAPELGLKKIPRVMPLWIASAVSAVTEGFASLTGIQPLLPAGQLHFLKWGAVPVADRARTVLGWKTVDFRDGFQATLAYLREKGKL